MNEEKTKMEDADKKHARSKHMNCQDASPDKKKQRQQRKVHFACNLVDKTVEAPDYNRTSVLNDIYSCDVCGIRIPGGIKGYEPFATCATCHDGFDVCGKCCGIESIMTICQTTIFSPESDATPTIRVKHHAHDLHVVNRSAEILWANEGAKECR